MILFFAGEPQGSECISIRYVMAIMGSIGMAILYGFKVNVSIAIVSMVNHTAVRLSNQKHLEAPKIVEVDESVCTHADLSQYSSHTSQVQSSEIKNKIFNSKSL